MGSSGKDFYKVLELDRNANEESIKKSYRRLVSSIPYTRKLVIV